jgi:hypothetical protein
VSRRSEVVMPPKTRLYTATMKAVNDITVAVSWDYVDTYGAEYSDVPATGAHADSVDVVGKKR